MRIGSCAYQGVINVRFLACFVFLKHPFWDSPFGLIGLITDMLLVDLRSNRPELFLGKGVMKIYSKFTGQYPCRSVISIRLQSIFLEHLILRTPLGRCFWSFILCLVLSNFILGNCSLTFSEGNFSN